MDERMEEMANNVFSGVFQTDLPNELVSEAIDIGLKAKVIREDFNLNYTLLDASFTDEEGVENSYVLVEAEARFTLRSIGTNDTPVKVGVSLPDPQISALREQVIVTRVEINGEPIRGLDEKNSELQKAFADNDGAYGDVAFFAGEHELPERGDFAHIRACYKMAKEVEDTEVVRSLYPSNGVTLTVFDRTPGKRRVAAHPIHPGKFERAPDGVGAKGVYTWRLSRYLLPQQGIMFWWKLANRGDKQ